MSDKKQTKSRQRSTSRPKNTNLHHPEWNNNTDIIIVEDRNGSEKLFAKTSSTKTNRKHSISSQNSSSTLSHRPPFNLDTKIDGYDDVDENGKYRKKQSEAAFRAERKKSQIKQEEFNQQWAESLRDNFYH
uniref:Uncharacterized protein n=1 Tax=Panagrolaimus sp. PS1159 TaxID=55785 RepID=A0AC35FXD7_9BILA